MPVLLRQAGIALRSNAKEMVEMAMTKKRSILDWWCGQPWLYTTYFLGLAMLVTSVMMWQEWSVQERVLGVLCVLLPLHIFEELTWPDGFPFMMNALIQKSENPLAYPENRLTDMVTNFGAQLLAIAMLVFTPIAGNIFLVFAAFFGIGEAVVHTVFGIAAMRHYRPKGKRTLYTPGFITAVFLLLPVGVYSLHYLMTSGTFTLGDLWGLAFVAFLICFMIRLPMMISFKVKSTRFAYDTKGYFAKFEE